MTFLGRDLNPGSLDPESNTLSIEPSRLTMVNCRNQRRVWHLLRILKVSVVSVTSSRVLCLLSSVVRHRLAYFTDNRGPNVVSGASKQVWAEPMVLTDSLPVEMSQHARALAIAVIIIISV